MLNINLNAQLHQKYKAEIYRWQADLSHPDRIELVRVWEGGFENTITSQGKDFWLTALAVGLASNDLYVGLKNAGTLVVGDTAASHSGWTENTDHSGSTKPIWTPSSVSGNSVDNSPSPASFTMNSTFTVAGAFLCDTSAKTMSSGNLLGGANFDEEDAIGYPNDVLVVTITLSIG